MRKALALLFSSFFIHGIHSQETTDYKTIGYLEVLDTAFYNWVSKDAKIEIIAEGFTWTEGPLWVPHEQCLLFSDVPENKAYQWTEESGVEIFLNPSGYSGSENKQGSNGLILGPRKELFLCQTGNRAVAKLNTTISNPKPDYVSVANRYQGKRFNAPNDLVMDSLNNIYFTDPNFGLDLDEKELEFQGVFKLDTEGRVMLLTKKWPTPNGIGLSPKNDRLYIANSDPKLLLAYDLSASGELSNEKVLLDMTLLWEESVAKQQPDGMAVHSSGAIFLAGPDGILLIRPNGKHLGTIKTDKLTSNCTFNEDESILYITCDDLVLRVQLN